MERTLAKEIAAAPLTKWKLRAFEHHFTTGRTFVTYATLSDDGSREVLTSITIEGPVIDCTVDEKRITITDAVKADAILAEATDGLENAVLDALTSAGVDPGGAALEEKP